MEEPEVLPGQDVLGLLATTQVTEIQWVHGDDLCDCIFQRIGDWTNPYLARTMRVRLCCVWAELMKQYPELIQEIPASHNRETNTFETEPLEWNSEDADMPRALWYRQLAVKYKRPLSEIREKLKDQEPPRRVSAGTGIKTVKGDQRGANG